MTLPLQKPCLTGNCFEFYDVQFYLVLKVEHDNIIELGHRLTILIFRLLLWVESPHVSPLIVRLGEFSFHLNQLVPSTLFIKPSGIHVKERLLPGMEFR